MPIEIRELVIRATVALDWANQTANQTEGDIVCLKLPDDKKIAAYVKEYFRQQKAKAISFDQAKLTAFLVEWQAGLLK